MLYANSTRTSDGYDNHATDDTLKNGPNDIFNLVTKNGSESVIYYIASPATSYAEYTLAADNYGGINPNGYQSYKITPIVAIENK